jgi:RNA polymerase sigma-70 factor (ECF subfamily)
MNRAENPVTITIGRVKPESLSSTTQPDFDAVFQQYWPRLVGVLFRLTGDRDEAEDLALEVFWRMLKTPPVVDDLSDPGGWLYRVAVHLGYNALRSRKRRGRYEHAAGAQAAEASELSTPEVQVEQRLERERVRRILARMRPRSAQLLVLRHSGLSYAEVAEALGTKPSSVGTLLARAEKEFERLYHSERR